MDNYVLPEQLIETPVEYSKTDNPLILKPVYGSIKDQSVVFKQVEVYSASESQRAGREVRNSVIVAEFTCDKFSRVPKRIADKSKGVRSELTPQEEMLLAPVYERFRTQQSSTETPIHGWEACSDLEKGHLLNLGIFTVEALSRVEDKHKLGPSCDDLLERAERHLKTKRFEKGEEAKEEMLALMAEKEKLAAKAKEMEEKYFAELAKNEKKPTGKKGKKNESA